MLQKRHEVRVRLVSVVHIVGVNTDEVWGGNIVTEMLGIIWGH